MLIAAIHGRPAKTLFVPGPDRQLYHFSATLSVIKGAMSGKISALRRSEQLLVVVWLVLVVDCFVRNLASHSDTGTVMIYSSLLALSFLAAASAECRLSCALNETCYSTAPEAMECMSSMPFNSEWATATVDVLSECLENYGFLQLAQNSGPPYLTKVNVEQELRDTQKMIDKGEFASDMDFQEHVQDFIQITQDAHTRYQKPVCYSAVFLQPFSFDMRIVQVGQAPDSVSEEPKAFLMRNLYTDEYLKLFPDSPIASLFGQEVKLLNGLEFTTEISSWADSHETRGNNRGVRFNQALRSYLYRSAIQYNVRPLDDLKVTMANDQTYVIPWMATYTAGLGNVDYCAAVGENHNEERSLKFPEKVNPKHHPELLDPPIPLSKTALMSGKTSADRVVIVPSDAPNAVSCFTQFVSSSQAATAGVSSVLVMKVASFAPDSVMGFLNDVETCINSEYDLMVVDVMQNGGGIVCLGLRLLELLIEDYYNDHSQIRMNYDMTHSELMDTYIDVVNVNDGYVDPETGEPFPDGKSYYYGRNVTQGGVYHERTNYFALDCSGMEKLPVGFKPKKFLPPERLVILTDGTCGSTCACFTRIPQEHGKATLVAAGGLWDESMDVSSFAGGFVANPDSMADIARKSGLEFPKFLTNQKWQFDWAVWYSEVFPTRQAQFVVTEPDYREAFWGFPHSSIDADVTTLMVSTLYDRVIASSVQRLAE